MTFKESWIIGDGKMPPSFLKTMLNTRLSARWEVRPNLYCIFISRSQPRASIHAEQMKQGMSTSELLSSTRLFKFLLNSAKGQEVPSYTGVYKNGHKIKGTRSY